MTTTITLLSGATGACTGPSCMFPAPGPAINGTVTIVVTGNPSGGVGLVVSLFTGAEFAEQSNAASIRIAAAGTYTLSATNSVGIRAALLSAPATPVTVTAAF